MIRRLYHEIKKFSPGDLTRVMDPIEWLDLVSSAA